MSIRKRMNVLFGTLLLTGSLFSQNVCVSTPETSLVLSAPVGGELKHVYYGDKLSEVDLQNINLTGTPDMPAYPVYGLNCPGESALAVKHADGNMTLQMEIVQVKTSKEENAEITAIELKDKVYPFYVNVYYKSLSRCRCHRDMDRNPTSGKETGYTQSVCLCFLTYSPGQCLAISSLRIMGERRAFVSRGIGTRHEGNKE